MEAVIRDGYVITLGCWRSCEMIGRNRECMRSDADCRPIHSIRSMIPGQAVTRNGIIGQNQRSSAAFRSQAIWIQDGEAAWNSQSPGAIWICPAIVNPENVIGNNRVLVVIKNDNVPIDIR